MDLFSGKMAGLFHVCQGTCLCASSSGEGYGKGKVLYCYGEVVLQRTSLRSGDQEEQNDQEEVYTIQIVQLVSLVVLLLAVLLVLLTIKQGLSKIQKQIKKILVMMPALSSPPTSRPNTLEKKQCTGTMAKKAPNGDCLKQQKEELGLLRGPDKLPQQDSFYSGSNGNNTSRLLGQDRDRDSIRFEKEEVRSLNHYQQQQGLLPPQYHHHDKIERIDSFPDSVTDVT